MPDYFTEDDVTAAYAVYDSPEVECPHADPSWYVAECDHCRTARVLAAVAPAIAARALREAADYWESGPNMVNGAVFVDFLRMRAEQVSGDPSVAAATSVANEVERQPNVPQSLDRYNAETNLAYLVLDPVGRTCTWLSVGSSPPRMKLSGRWLSGDE